MAVYSDFSSWLTALGGSFGRASAASRVNAAGLLESVSSNVLCFNHDPITLAPRGLLFNGPRTGISLFNDDLQTTAEAGSSRPWVRSGTTLVLNATTGTDGAATAQKIVESADGSAVAHDRHQSFTVVAGTKYALKVRLKAAERTQAQIQLYDGGSVNQYPIVNLSAGAVVASNGASVTTTQWANGWWEFSFAVTPGTTTLSVYIYPAVGGSKVYQGDGSSGIYFDHCQVEAGSFSTSDIVTTSSSATRAADVLTFPTAPWFNASAGTVLMEFDALDVATFQRLFSIDNGSISSRIDPYINNGNLYAEWYQSGGTNVGLNLGAVTAGVTNKLCVAWSANDFAAVLNGGAVQTGNSGAVPTGLTSFKVGRSAVDDGHLYGHVRRLLYEDSRWTNTEIRRLTT